MSIIEKAASRLKAGLSSTTAEPVATPPTTDLPTPPAPAPAPRADRLEQAMARAAAPQAALQAELQTDLQTDLQAELQAAPPAAPVATPPATLVPAAEAVIRPAPKTVEINLGRLATMGFISAGGARSLISEQFRMVKRPLIRKAFTRSEEAPIPGNLIMVTSAVPGEGKTFCAINLALSIAMELDHTVLLVDVDVARPSVLKTLGVEASPGLMDVLLDDKLDIGDVMLKTNVDTLSVLPAGRAHPQAAELLASQAMQILLEEISTRYPDRIVIFDSPPLLLTSEAHVLASRMGQIVLVVEAESTSQQMVKSALDQIKSFQNVNLLYNKSRALPGAKYGYYWEAY